MSSDPSQPLIQRLVVSLPATEDFQAVERALTDWLGERPIHLRAIAPPVGLAESRVDSFLEYDALSAAVQYSPSYAVSMLRRPGGWSSATAYHSPVITKVQTFWGLGETFSATDGIVTQLKLLDRELAGGKFGPQTVTEPSFDRDRSVVWESPPGTIDWQPATLKAPHAILSGSFFPLHDGHRKFAAAAGAFLQLPVCFELPVVNADKPAIDLISLHRRAVQFLNETLLATAAPTFAEKSVLFPESTFLIGWDTAVRVLDRRFSPDGQLESVFDQIAQQGCRFLVAARTVAGEMKTLRDLPLPSGYEEIFVELPADLFYEEISSTEIRERWWRGEIECAGL